MREKILSAGRNPLKQVEVHGPDWLERKEPYERNLARLIDERVAYWYHQRPPSDIWDARHRKAALDALHATYGMEIEVSDLSNFGPSAGRPAYGLTNESRIILAGPPNIATEADLNRYLDQCLEVLFQEIAEQRDILGIGRPLTHTEAASLMGLVTGVPVSTVVVNKLAAAAREGEIGFMERLAYEDWAPRLQQIDDITLRQSVGAVYAQTRIMILDLLADAWWKRSKSQLSREQQIVGDWLRNDFVPWFRVANRMATQEYRVNELESSYVKMLRGAIQIDAEMHDHELVDLVSELPRAPFARVQMYRDLTRLEEWLWRHAWAAYVTPRDQEDRIFEHFYAAGRGALESSGIAADIAQVEWSFQAGPVVGEWKPSSGETGRSVCFSRSAVLLGATFVNGYTNDHHAVVWLDSMKDRTVSAIRNLPPELKRRARQQLETPTSNQTEQRLSWKGFVSAELGLELTEQALQRCVLRQPDRVWFGAVPPVDVPQLFARLAILALHPNATYRLLHMGAADFLDEWLRKNVIKNFTHEEDIRESAKEAYARLQREIRSSRDLENIDTLGAWATDNHLMQDDPALWAMYAKWMGESPPFQLVHELRMEDEARVLAPSGPFSSGSLHLATGTTFKDEEYYYNVLEPCPNSPGFRAKIARSSRGWEYDDSLPSNLRVILVELKPHLSGDDYATVVAQMGGRPFKKYDADTGLCIFEDTEANPEELLPLLGYFRDSDGDIRSGPTTFAMHTLITMKYFPAITRLLRMVEQGRLYAPDHFGADYWQRNVALEALKSAVRLAVDLECPDELHAKVVEKVEDLIRKQVRALGYPGFQADLQRYRIQLRRSPGDESGLVVAVSAVEDVPQESDVHLPEASGMRARQLLPVFPADRGLQQSEGFVSLADMFDALTTHLEGEALILRQELSRGLRSKNGILRANAVAACGPLPREAAQRLIDAALSDQSLYVRAAVLGLIWRHDLRDRIGFVRETYRQFKEADNNPGFQLRKGSAYILRDWGEDVGEKSYIYDPPFGTDSVSRAWRTAATPLVPVAIATPQEWDTFMTSLNEGAMPQLDMAAIGRLTAFLKTADFNADRRQKLKAIFSAESSGTRRPLALECPWLIYDQETTRLFLRYRMNPFGAGRRGPDATDSGQAINRLPQAVKENAMADLFRWTSEAAHGAIFDLSWMLKGISGIGQVPVVEQYLNAWLRSGDISIISWAMDVLLHWKSNGESIEMFEPTILEAFGALWSRVEKLDQTQRQGAVQAAGLLPDLAEKYTWARRFVDYTYSDNINPSWQMLGLWLEDSERLSPSMAETILQNLRKLETLPRQDTSHLLIQARGLHRQAEDLLSKARQRFEALPFDLRLMEPELRSTLENLQEHWENLNQNLAREQDSSGILLAFSDANRLLDGIHAFIQALQSVEAFAHGRGHRPFTSAGNFAGAAERPTQTMTKGKDLYEILGVGKEADADDIRKAYRRLARQYHPDLNPGDKVAEERFKEISEAYEILSDPKTKSAYDQFGSFGAPPKGTLLRGLAAVIQQGPDFKATHREFTVIRGEIKREAARLELTGLVEAELFKRTRDRVGGAYTYRFADWLREAMDRDPTLIDQLTRLAAWALAEVPGDFPADLRVELRRLATALQTHRFSVSADILGAVEALRERLAPLPTARIAETPVSDTQNEKFGPAEEDIQVHFVFRGGEPIYHQLPANYQRIIDDAFDAMAQWIPNARSREAKEALAQIYFWTLEWSLGNNRNDARTASEWTDRLADLITTQRLARDSISARSLAILGSAPLDLIIYPEAEPRCTPAPPWWNWREKDGIARILMTQYGWPVRDAERAAGLCLIPFLNTPEKLNGWAEVVVGRPLPEMAQALRTQARLEMSQIDGLPPVKDWLDILKSENVGYIIARVGEFSWDFVLKESPEIDRERYQRYHRLLHEGHAFSQREKAWWQKTFTSEHFRGIVFHSDKLEQYARSHSMNVGEYLQRMGLDPNLRAVVVITEDVKEPYRAIHEETFHFLEGLDASQLAALFSIYEEKVNDFNQLMCYPEKLVGKFNVKYTGWTPAVIKALQKRYRDDPRMDPNYDIPAMLEALHTDLEHDASIEVDGRPVPIIKLFISDYTKDDSSLRWSLLDAVDYVIEHERFSDHRPLSSNWQLQDTLVRGSGSSVDESSLPELSMLLIRKPLYKLFHDFFGLKARPAYWWAYHLGLVIEELRQFGWMAIDKQFLSSAGFGWAVGINAAFSLLHLVKRDKDDRVQFWNLPPWASTIVRSVIRALLAIAGTGVFVGAQSLISTVMPLGPPWLTHYVIPFVVSCLIHTIYDHLVRKAHRNNSLRWLPTLGQEVPPAAPNKEALEPSPIHAAIRHIQQLMDTGQTEDIAHKNAIHQTLAGLLTDLQEVQGPLDIEPLITKWAPFYPNAGNRLRIDEMPLLIAFTRRLLQDLEKKMPQSLEEAVQLGFKLVVKDLLGAAFKRAAQLSEFRGIETQFTIPVRNIGVQSPVGSEISIVFRNQPPELDVIEEAISRAYPALKLLDEMEEGDVNWRLDMGSRIPNEEGEFGLILPGGDLTLLIESGLPEHPDFTPAVVAYDEVPNDLWNGPDGEDRGWGETLRVIHALTAQGKIIRGVTEAAANMLKDISSDSFDWLPGQRIIFKVVNPKRIRGPFAIRLVMASASTPMLELIALPECEMRKQLEAERDVRVPAAPTGRISLQMDSHRPGQPSRSIPHKSDQDHPEYPIGTDGRPVHDIPAWPSNQPRRFANLDQWLAGQGEPALSDVQFVRELLNRLGTGQQGFESMQRRFIESIGLEPAFWANDHWVTFMEKVTNILNMNGLIESGWFLNCTDSSFQAFKVRSWSREEQDGHAVFLVDIEDPANRLIRPTAGAVTIGRIRHSERYIVLDRARLSRLARQDRSWIDTPKTDRWTPVLAERQRGHTDDELKHLWAYKAVKEEWTHSDHILRINRKLDELGGSASAAESVKAIFSVSSVATLWEAYAIVNILDRLNDGFITNSKELFEMAVESAVAIYHISSAPSPQIQQKAITDSLTVGSPTSSIHAMAEYVAIKGFALFVDLITHPGQTEFSSYETALDTLISVDPATLWQLLKSAHPAGMSRPITQTAA